MPWAIAYNSSDLAVIGPAADTIQAGGGGISTADRNAVRAMWTGGISAWATAPVAPPGLQQGDPDTRILVCSTGSLAQFTALVDKYVDSGKLPNRYLKGLARDMRRPSGGRPSWP